MSGTRNAIATVERLDGKTEYHAAGKVHAVLARRWTKGRDLFDLAWYLTRVDRPSPNLTLLRNALEQTGWPGPMVDEKNWRGIVRERVASLDWASVVADVDPFLEDNGRSQASGS